MRFSGGGGMTAMATVAVALLAAALLGTACARAQGPALAPAGTLHSDFSAFPQLVFPSQPALSAALDPRRQLSLQQQTHILTDIQQHHHRFFQPQTQERGVAAPPAPRPAHQLLYSQVGATAPTVPLRETEPIFTPQTGQFVRFHAQAAAPTAPAAAPPPPPPEAQQPLQPLQPQQSHEAFGGRQPFDTSFAPVAPQRSQHPLGPLAALAPLPPTASAAAARPLHHNSLQGAPHNASTAEQRSLRRGPGDSGAVGDAGAAGNIPRPRARSEDGAPPQQQLFLPDERQRLFDQIKEYQQPQQQRPLFHSQGSPSFLAPEHRSSVPTVSKTQSLPQLTDINDNPLKPKPSLREQQRQQQLQAQLQKQFQLQLVQRQELIRQLKQALASNAQSSPPTHGDDDVLSPSGAAPLANGQQLQSFERATERSSVAQNTVSVRSTAAAGPPPTATPPPTAPLLPTAPPSAPPTTHAKAPKALFDELTKGVLPPGAQFEVIRHKQDGGLEEVRKLPSNLPNKKVTFVFLEEQPDGTVKVQGVRGSENESAGKNSSSPVDIDSIIKKIQEGNLKLPSSTKLSGAPTTVPPKASTPQESILSPTFLSKSQGERTTPSPRPNSLLPTISSPKASDLLPRLSDNTVGPSHTPEMEFFPSVSVSNFDSLSSTQNPYFDLSQFQQSTTTTTTQPPPPPPPPSVNPGTYSTDVRNSESLFISSPSSQPAYNTRNAIKNTNAALPPYSKPSQDHPPQVAAAPAHRPTPPARTSPAPPPPTPRAPSRAPHFSPMPVTTVPPSPPVLRSSASPSDSPFAATQASPTPPPPPPPPRVAFPGSEAAASTNGSGAAAAAPAGVLTQVLKKEGLFAMAKFLKDSGLDAILNDTGPYTIFVPTDKAFRSLLVQLGGPDKAEIKFRENPRLLSGLLLHHVIPGAFRLDELQDEMTGVSLAGTQLRVNTYRTQDTHWNDVQVTTINGARVVRDLHDLSVPQGVAHALDRVMFPLPVGDLLQTLAADRERRFTRLLRLVRVAGMDALLSGARTHTLLAPTDKALNSLPAGELQRALKDAGRARALLQRHLLTGALYGAGLRFYQERPTLAAGRPVALAKADGQLKANNAHVVTPNVPATNGVLHVIDAVL